MITTAMSLQKMIMGMNDAFPEKGHLYMVLGVEHLNNGDFDYAVESFEKAAEQYDMSEDADCFNVASEIASTLMAKIQARKPFFVSKF